MATWFDATTIDPSAGSAQLPVGNHPVVVRSTSKVPVKDKPQCGMLVLRLEIIDGPNKGTQGDYRLNLWSDSQQAAEIAGKQLSAVCHVTQRYQLNDQANPGSELVGIPFRVNVALQKGDNPNGYTEVTGASDMSGNIPTRGQAAPAAAPAAPAAAAPSWGTQGQPAAPAPAAAPAWGAPAAPAAPAPAAAPAWGAPQPATGPAPWGPR